MVLPRSILLLFIAMLLISGCSSYQRVEEDEDEVRLPDYQTDIYVLFQNSRKRNLQVSDPSVIDSETVADMYVHLLARILAEAEVREDEEQRHVRGKNCRTASNPFQAHHHRGLAKKVRNRRGWNVKKLGRKLEGSISDRFDKVANVIRRVNDVASNAGGIAAVGAKAN